MINRALAKIAWASVTFLSITTPASAQDEGLLETLLENGAITQGQYDQLKEQNTAQQQQQARPANKGSVVVNKKGSLSGKSNDAAFRFEFRGRIQADTAIYDNDKQQLGSGSEIRRVRFSLKGTVWSDWEYITKFDFAENEVDLKDAYIEYIGFEPLTLKVGNMKEFFSLEEQMSSNDFTFMERSLANTFAPGRNFGLSAQSYGNTWSFGAGFFGEGVDDKDELDEGYGFSTRVTYSPINEEDKLIHIGGSVAYRIVSEEEDEDGNKIKETRFRSRPESHISGVRLINTGKFDADDTTSYGLEAAAVLGPYSVQGEYLRASVNRPEGSNLDFDGFYIFASWALTGESRPYWDKHGEFKGIVPRSIVGNGGTGAWEIALRYSQLDLNDQDIRGGKESNVTLGLNWYATPNIRFMANYINVNSKKEGETDDPNIYQMRAQVSF